MNNTVSDIFYSRAKVGLDFKGTSIKDALAFGFSYIESEDHVVEFIAANPKVMKKIFEETLDSKINMRYGAIGELWTARLLVAEKLQDNQILFSNNTFSAVINLNLNQNNKEFPDGQL